MINTREIAVEYRLAHWAKVMQERSQSGLSIKVYCQQLGICGNTYFYWQRRVRAAAATELGLRACDTQKQPHVSFSEVRVSADTACPGGTAAMVPDQLRLDTGGVRLTVDSAYPVEQLAQLVRALTRPC